MEGGSPFQKEVDEEVRWRLTGRTRVWTAWVARTLDTSSVNQHQVESTPLLRGRRSNEGDERKLMWWIEER